MKKLRPLYVLQLAHATDTDLKNWIRQKHLPFSGTRGRLRMFTRAEALQVIVFASLGRVGVPLRSARYSAPEIVKQALGPKALQHVTFDPNAGIGRWFPTTSEARISDLAAKVGPVISGDGTTAPSHLMITINVGEMLRSLDFLIETLGEVEGSPAVPSIGDVEDHPVDNEGDDTPAAGYASDAKIKRRSREARGGGK